MRNKGLQAVFLDLILAVQPQLLLYLQLYRQAVGIPAGLAGHHIALHGAVAGDHILDNAGKHMPDVGLAVGRGGAVIKDIRGALLAGINALFKDMLLFPEGLYLLFLLHKIHIGGNALVHFVFTPFVLPFLLFRSAAGRSFGLPPRRCGKNFVGLRCP